MRIDEKAVICPLTWEFRFEMGAVAIWNGKMDEGDGDVCLILVNFIC